MTQYVLELQQLYPDNPPIHPKTGFYMGKYEFVGYIDKVFTSMKDTAEYYNQCNPHMPKLSPNRNQVSAWDTNTYTRCVIRKYEGFERRRIPEFSR
jgi:hypothetical protein